MASLNLFVDLPKIRKAYDARTLQMFHMSAYDQCTYVGPCAIGICLPEDTRVLVPNIPIHGLISRGIVEVPEDQAGDWLNLQVLHDVGNIRHFENFLLELEIRYAQP